MAHLVIEQVEAYAKKHLPLSGINSSEELLLRRFLSYHRWRWLFPLKRKWWIITFRKVSYLLREQPNAPSRQLCLELMVRKNQAYGVEPLLLTGLRGIAVRCLSKSSRLVNVSKGAVWGDEAVIDTLVDLFCYCILALMMIDGRLK